MFYLWERLKLLVERPARFGAAAALENRIPIGRTNASASSSRAANVDLSQCRNARGALIGPPVMLGSYAEHRG